MATAWRKSPLPANWKQIRGAVMRRDKGRCQIDGPRCVEVATDVDHMGDHDDHRLIMLQAVCGPCHDSKTGREAQAARPRLAPRARPVEAHPSLRMNNE